MPQQQISLEGLPEPVARAIEVVVQMAHRLAATKKKQRPEVEPLRASPKWEGPVLGNLSRSEIHDDV